MTTFVLAHGAGAGQSHPFMVAWRERLCTLGPVHAFEYPYMEAGKKAPNRLPKLLERHRRAYDEARAEHGGPVVLIGKSMGSRVGCHLANEPDVDVAGVVCLGYPLRTPKGAVRDEVLLAMDVPVLFVQGTRDRLCPLDLLDEVRDRMGAATALHVVDDGDHSLKVARRTLKATGTTQEDADQSAFEAVSRFVGDLSGCGDGDHARG